MKYLVLALALMGSAQAQEYDQVPCKELADFAGNMAKERNAGTTLDEMETEIAQSVPIHSWFEYNSLLDLVYQDSRSPEETRGYVLHLCQRNRGVFQGHRF